MDLARLAQSVIDLIGGSVETNPLGSYLVIVLLMLLENVFPPVPTEMVMPLAGFLVHEGKLQLVPVVLAGLLGTVLGAWFWYAVGRWVNEKRLERLVDRHGGWLGLRPEMLARSRRWFARHGAAVVFWGRCLPGIRPFVSLPAGIELMPQPAFLVWTTAGSLIWVLALTLAGKALGSGYVIVVAWLESVSELVRLLCLLLVCSLAAWLAIRLVRRRGVGR